MQHLIEHYGYLGILLGTFLEGETILILGGFAAHQGYLSLEGVVFCAFAGSLCSDQLLFFGESAQPVAVAQTSKLGTSDCPGEKSDRALSDCYYPDLPFLVWPAYRHPFPLGMSKIRWREFIVFNVFSSILWSTVIGYAGYLFGHALAILLGDVMHYQAMAVMGIALAVFSIAGLRLLRKSY